MNLAELHQKNLIEHENTIFKRKRACLKIIKELGIENKTLLLPLYILLVGRYEGRKHTRDCNFEIDFEPILGFIEQDLDSGEIEEMFMNLEERSFATWRTDYLYVVQAYLKSEDVDVDQFRNWAELKRNLTGSGRLQVVEDAKHADSDNVGDRDEPANEEFKTEAPVTRSRRRNHVTTGSRRKKRQKVTEDLENQSILSDPDDPIPVILSESEDPILEEDVHIDDVDLHLETAVDPNLESGHVQQVAVVDQQDDPQALVDVQQVEYDEKSVDDVVFDEQDDPVPLGDVQVDDQNNVDQQDDPDSVPAVVQPLVDVQQVESNQDSSQDALEDDQAFAPAVVQALPVESQDRSYSNEQLLRLMDQGDFKDNESKLSNILRNFREASCFLSQFNNAKIQHFLTTILKSKLKRIKKYYH
jgi:hypothetical protein